MSEMKFFKIKQGTKYHEAVKQHLNLLPKWKPIYAKVSELLDEKITRMVQTPNYLRIEYSELKKEENKKVFKKDGTLKANMKKAKEIEVAYKEIIEEAGLDKYESLGHINFCYGVMRYHGETLITFKTSDQELYYEANFDLEDRVKNSFGESLVIPITEIEHQEKYLEEIKKQSE